MVTIKVGNRKIRPDQFAEELEKAIITQVKREIPKRVRDPETGERIPVRVSGTKLRNLKIRGV